MLCGDLNGKEIQTRGYICIHMLIHFAMQQKLTQQWCKQQYYKKETNTDRRSDQIGVKGELDAGRQKAHTSSRNINK